MGMDQEAPLVINTDPIQRVRLKYGRTKDVLLALSLVLSIIAIILALV